MLAYPLKGVVAPGTTIGRWTVIAEAPRRSSVRYLLCRCECGTVRECFIGNLRKGVSLSCGCLIADKHRTHGMSNSPEIVLWKGMIQRCHNPKSSEYRNYGGRGIAVCKRWRDSFQAFFADMGKRPDPKLTLDRINNDGDYKPGNVRWATRSEQMLNTRLSHAVRSERCRQQALKRWHPESVPS